MISVTAAAHSFRRTSRSMGTHLKAFGSGRVALGSIDEDSEAFGPNRYFTYKQLASRPQNRFFGSLRKFFLKFFQILARFLNVFCPLISLLVDVPVWSEPKSKRKREKREVQNSILDRLEDKLLLKIFSFCDSKSILNLEVTCSHLRLLIHKHCNELPKVQKDQIKLHFDEGEVIIFPMDERKIPTRFQMPPIEHLGRNLRHLSTLSLFIRGLIPAETIPVLKRLARYPQSASQIYFLWCEFDESAAEQLKSLFMSNVETLSDIGFEVCNPTKMISDNLIEHNLARLVSLRVWHENTSSGFAITDRTLQRLVNLYRSNASCPLEILDVAGGNFTVDGLCALIEAWYSQVQPKNDLYISFHNCNFTQASLIHRSTNIPLNSKRSLDKRGFRLTVNIN